MTAALTEPAAEAAIGAACHTLHLPTVRGLAGELADAAARERLTHRAYLAELLAAETDQRDARRRERRIREARFPRIKRLDSFDLGAAPGIPRPPWPPWPPAPGSRPASPWSCSATPAPARATC